MKHIKTRTYYYCACVLTTVDALKILNNVLGGWCDDTLGVGG